MQLEYATLQPIRKNILNSIPPPDIQTVAVDSDFDEIVDQYNITLRVKKPVNSWKLRKVDLIVAFDYQLNNIIKLKMEGLAIVSIDTLASDNLNPIMIKTNGVMNLV